MIALVGCSGLSSSVILWLSQSKDLKLESYLEQHSDLKSNLSNRLTKSYSAFILMVCAALASAYIKDFDKLCLLWLQLPALYLMIRIDLRFYFLPDWMQIYSSVIAAIYLTYRIYQSETNHTIFAGLIIGLSFFILVALGRLMTNKITGRDILGLGDIKLLFWMTLVLGDWLPYTLVIGGVATLLVSSASKLNRESHPVPFGPGLILSYLVLLTIQA